MNCFFRFHGINSRVLSTFEINQDLDTPFRSVLFADVISLFMPGKDPEAMCDATSNDVLKVQEWLYCNKLSLNVLKTQYKIFTARNKTATDLGILSRARKSCENPLY